MFTPWRQNRSMCLVKQQLQPFGQRPSRLQWRKTQQINDGHTRNVKAHTQWLHLHVCSHLAHQSA